MSFIESNEWWGLIIWETKAQLVRVCSRTSPTIVHTRFGGAMDRDGFFFTWSLINVRTSLWDWSIRKYVRGERWKLSRLFFMWLAYLGNIPRHNEVVFSSWRQKFRMIRMFWTSRTCAYNFVGINQRCAAKVTVTFFEFLYVYERCSDVLSAVCERKDD